jgi:hypothetical protein
MSLPRRVVIDAILLGFHDQSLPLHTEHLDRASLSKLFLRI